MQTIQTCHDLQEKDMQHPVDEKQSKPPENQEEQNPNKVRNRIIFATVVVILAGGTFSLVWFLQIPPIIYTNVQFDFHVYCPLYYDQGIPQDVKDTASGRLMNSYVVSMQEHFHNDNHSQSYFFCGLARTWNGSCQNASYICSKPGPVFDLKANEEISVVWRNQIDLLNVTQIVDKGSMSACYDLPRALKPHRCFPYAKKNSWENCTYEDPTDLGNQVRKVEIKNTSIPVSTHIHGLEVRPTFDGNPLSWFSNQGNGVGYFSAEMKYFDYFNKTLLKIIEERYSSNTSHTTRVNIYKNTQLPGSLWYHDHAMGTTGLNVKKGLNGMYLIRTDESEKVLPTKKYSKILLISRFSDPTPHSFLTDRDEILTSNATYRFRILNSDYEAHYGNITFVHSCIPSLNPLSCVLIRFIVIGADSALRKTPVPNMNTFRLASAERIDLLISFPQNLSSLYSVYVHDFDTKTTFAQITISGSDKTQNYNIPSELPVPFYDLSQIDNTTIRKRMRPLILYNAGLHEGIRFSINGHPGFHDGNSENPQIGSIEDWYFINLVAVSPHPIHVHLINYQLIQEYSLKKITATTTYYHCDFFLEYADLHMTACCSNPTYLAYQQKYKSGEDLTFAEYQDMASFVSNVTTDQAIVCFANFANERNITNNVSGIDLHLQCQNNGSCHNEYNGQNCSFLQSRYICDDISDQLYEYEKGWKEVGLTNPLTALVARIRWTKTDFENKTNEPYFHEEIKKLIEFPGYVYHCHFLPHEDNVMMRPIMLLPPHGYQGEYWSNLSKIINKDLGCKAS